MSRTDDKLLSILVWFLRPEADSECDFRFRCGAKFLKKDMESHLESCEHRMMECELCEGRMKVMEAEVSFSLVSSSLPS